MRLTTFGDYTLPTQQTEFSTNFGNAVPRTERLPGLSGGYDLYGNEVAEQEIGNVRVAFWLFAPGLRAKVDEVYQMISKGKRLLFLDPEDGNEQRYTEARVNNIQASEAVEDFTHERLKVTVNFQCAEPFWRTIGTEAPTWGSFKWGSGTWGGTTSPTAVSGTSTDITVSYAGTAPTFARVIIAPGTGDSCDNPVVQRVVGGTVIDEVNYTGTLTDTDTLVINSRDSRVTLNGAAAYDDFSFTRGYWIKLLPGDNTIRVGFDNAGDAADVTVRFFNRYY